MLLVISYMPVRLFVCAFQKNVVLLASFGRPLAIFYLVPLVFKFLGVHLPLTLCTAKGLRNFSALVHWSPKLVGLVPHQQKGFLWPGRQTSLMSAAIAPVLLRTLRVPEIWYHQKMAVCQFFFDELSILVNNADALRAIGLSAEVIGIARVSASLVLHPPGYLV